MPSTRPPNSTRLPLVPLLAWLCVALPQPCAAAGVGKDDPPAQAQAGVADQSALEASSRVRLARVFAAFSSRAVRKDEPALADLDLALLLAQQAVELNPDDVWAWRALLGAASLGDQTDAEVEAARRKAVERIAALDPTDERIRVRRLLDSISLAPTAEERIAKYLKWLEPPQRDAIGSAVAARLALDLAILLKRTGDQAGFEKWLAEAVILDPAYPDAASMAAGYFRFATNDSAEEAELLLAALTANPLDLLPMRGFATHMLDRGAYRTAARFLGISASLSRTEFPIISYDQLLADLALATWASGRAQEADDIIRIRVQRMNEYFWGQLADSDPTLLADPVRLRSRRFPVPSSQLAVRTAILRDTGDTVGWKALVDDTYYSLDAEAENLLERSQSLPQPENTIAAAYLQAAFFAYWLGEDAAKGDEYKEKAASVLALTPEAEARFSAWSTLRSTESAQALAMFQALTDSDVATRLGTALAMIAAGQPREGAQLLLAIARETPGTLIGVDARSRLQRLLGTAIPPTDEVQRLEAVGASVPASFDQIFKEGASTLTFRIRLGSLPADATQSIPIFLEVTNSAPIPLAIDKFGPVQELVALQSSISVSGRNTSFNVPYMLISLNRALNIPSRTTLAVPIDLAYTDVGVAALQFLHQGCGIELRGIVNWETTSGGFRAGPFGDPAEAELMQIDGVRMTDEWMAAAIARAHSPQSAKELFDLVAVVGAAAQASVRMEELSPGRAALFASLWGALPSILGRLDPVSQAWVLFVMNDNVQEMKPALDVARSSSHPIVQLAYMVRRASVSNDPVIGTAISSGDAVIKRYGQIVQEMLLHDEALTRRDFALGTSGTAPASGTQAPGPGQPPAPSPQP
ncbi:MAG: hypothetical protein SGJ11_01285 [Phycisphaerae bacterium]|nr:hypothetical protein [Phycisphaerae bacterium]